MPMVASSICFKCGKSYFLHPLDVAVLPNMALREVKRSPGHQPKKILTSWTDWIEHISLFCEDCRYSRPPSKCLDDWDNHFAEIKKEKQKEREIDNADNVAETLEQIRYRQELRSS